MSYWDGFIAAVPKANKEAYLQHAKEAAPIFFEYGALRLFEGWGDDVPDGELTSFPLAVKKKEDEEVVFSFVEWPSKEVRAAAWEKMQNDDRMKMADMPFDGKRMIYGGFTGLVDMKP